MLFILEMENEHFLAEIQNVKRYLVSKMRYATLLNETELNELLQAQELNGGIHTETGMEKIVRIHELHKGTSVSFERLNQNTLAYEVDDIIDFDGNLYEIEGINNGEVQLSHEDGCKFPLELEYIQLVCKAQDRRDK